MGSPHGVAMKIMSSASVEATRVTEGICGEVRCSLEEAERSAGHRGVRERHCCVARRGRMLAVAEASSLAVRWSRGTASR
jgi:uncharacterized low-complexity protein